MTEASVSIVKLIDTLDKLKSHLGSIKPESSGVAFSDSKFSAFPLFYLSDKISGDINDMEPESISFMFGDNSDNALRVKAMSATLAANTAWTNAFAFNTFVESANSMPIQADTLSICSASELTWGIINMAAIDSALTIPIKSDVLSYVKAALDEEGWAIPPLFLMFKNITDLYDNQEAIEEVKKYFGELSLEQILHMDSINGMGIDNRNDLKNYLIRNQEIAMDLSGMYSKLMFDWTTIINGA